MKSSMKTVFPALLLFVAQILAVGARAGTIKEVDYPIQYEVMATSKTDKSADEKSCTMTLRDRAKTNVAINVEKKGFGACHLLDSGKIYEGRQNDKKNEIELVITVGEDKARIENWRIIGTVDINPKDSRVDARQN